MMPEANHSDWLGSIIAFVPTEIAVIAHCILRAELL